jgi:hypothetical protein
MPTSGKHKTVQIRILEYDEAIGLVVVPREEVWLRHFKIGSSTFS